MTEKREGESGNTVSDLAPPLQRKEAIAAYNETMSMQIVHEDHRPFWPESRTNAGATIFPPLLTITQANRPIWRSDCDLTEKKKNL